MNVCFVSDQAFPAWGGEGVSAERFCRGLAGRRHRVTVLTSRVRRAGPPSGIRCYRFPAVVAGKRGPLAIPSSWWLETVLRREQCDVMHANLPSYLGWRAVRLARKAGCPTVAGFHVQVGNLIPYRGRWWQPLRRVVERWFRYFYRRVDVVVAPSRAAAEMLRRYRSGPIRVISNGITLQDVDREPVSEAVVEAFRRRWNLPAGPVVLYAGRLSPEKNVRFLLRVARALRDRGIDVPLLIVGRGCLEGVLRRGVRRLGLQGRVVFAGYLEHEDLGCAYAASRIFLLPSRCELQGIAVLEAMAAGCALLVGDDPDSAARELVENEQNGYRVSLEDPTDAAEKIGYLTSHEEVLQRFRGQSRRLIQEHALTHSIDELEALYREVRQGRIRG